MFRNMSEPLCCAVMLTRDRHEMTRRAYLAFERQTVAHRMLILDTGKTQFLPDHCREVTSRTAYFRMAAGDTIGTLRNIANTFAVEKFKPEIIMHWDSDDVSHPNRIAEQVAFLQSSGADVVGYDELLFWRTGGTYTAGGFTYGFDYETSDPHNGTPWPQNEAWLYSHNKVPNRHAPGTSFCYWRKFWERNTFKDLPKNNESTGEDVPFLDNAKLATESSVYGFEEPRLIASIHGGNTMHYDQIEKKSQNWRRVSEWDEYARKAMAL